MLRRHSTESPEGISQLPKHPKQSLSRRVRATRTNPRVQIYPSPSTVQNPLRPIANDPFPVRKRCTLHYVQIVSLATSASANTYGTQLDINTNSLFLPTTGVGSAHQPLYFDQLTPLYSRYRVDAINVKIKFALIDSGQTNSVVCTALAAAPNVSSTLTGSTLDVVEEKPFCFNCELTTGSKAEGSFQQRCPMTMLTGLTPRQLLANGEDYSALVSASPARIPLLMVAVANYTAAAVNVKCTIELFYECEFWDRKIPAQS